MPVLLLGILSRLQRRSSAMLPRYSAANHTLCFAGLNLNIFDLEMPTSPEPAPELNFPWMRGQRHRPQGWRTGQNDLSVGARSLKLEEKRRMLQNGASMPFSV